MLHIKLREFIEADILGILWLLWKHKGWSYENGEREKNEWKSRPADQEHGEEMLNARQKLFTAFFSLWMLQFCLEQAQTLHSATALNTILF